MSDQSAPILTIPWYASQTLWGSILAAIMPMLGLALHFTVSAAQVQEIATDCAMVGGGIAGLVAFWYRLKAVHPIAGTKAAAAAQAQATAVTASTTPSQVAAAQTVVAKAS